jgi:hypothetical protein
MPAALKSNATSSPNGCWVSRRVRSRSRDGETRDGEMGRQGDRVGLFED